MVLLILAVVYCFDRISGALRGWLARDPLR